MGNKASRPTKTPETTVTVTSQHPTPGSSHCASPHLENSMILYLSLTFVTGVLLTLLTVAIVYLIRKRKRKYLPDSKRVAAQTSDLLPLPSPKLSPSPDDALVYSTLIPGFPLGESQPHNSKDLDPVVYAEVGARS
ncbi:transmembrane protein C1orf162 homolog [Ornithorhynchus anatinus]|uniref:transmembrane protein C1orf162 homolog n=1 Tax=Ornithorhynchus anatinus TaxID=9258 RepID=UPI0019D4D8C1|nr:transmembrane protein C1orf162 homolog [Ornithorhynchus anatinus]